MVTLKMLANACGVSISTVSKALNGAPDVSPSTAERVRKVASEMGYIPCAAAQYLKTSRTHCIGVIFKDGSNYGITHEHFAYVLNSFKSRAEELGYDIILISNRSGPWGGDYATHVQYRNCDGVAVLVADNASNAVREIIDSRIPVVSVDYTFNNCSAVWSDNVQGERDLVNYVYSRGHRKIAAIFGEDVPVTRLRSASFFRTCKELGLEIPEEYIASCHYHNTLESAEAVARMLDLPDPPTCILLPDDFALIGGKNEIERRGLSIPEDVSIAGFDGAMLGRVMNPVLTTVCQDTASIGRMAAEELVRAIEEGNRFLPREIMVHCTLEPGGTVAQLPVK